MKTSNKLLLAFLMLIFATPLLLALSLKSKIKNNEYVLRKMEDSNSGNGMHYGSFNSYKVLKLVSPAKGVFTCRLRPSKTPAYSYTNYTPNEDSIRVYNSSDTLYMEYIPHNNVTIHHNKNSIEYSSAYVTIEVNADLPSFEKLEIKGATVIIDSLPDNLPSMAVSLSDGGELKMGESGSKTESITPKTKTLTHISCRVADLTINATGSGLYFGPYFMTDHLQLNMSSTSALSVKDAIIKKVDGHLSDSISVNAGWKYLRKLAMLTER